MTSLPLNMWIILLEDDAMSFELRQKLCSVHVVVGIIIIVIVVIFVIFVITLVIIVAAVRCECLSNKSLVAVR